MEVWTGPLACLSLSSELYWIRIRVSSSELGLFCSCSLDVKIDVTSFSSISNCSNNDFNSLNFQIIWENKTDRGLIPDRGTWPLSTKQAELGTLVVLSSISFVKYISLVTKFQLKSDWRGSPRIFFKLLMLNFNWQIKFCYLSQLTFLFHLRKWHQENWY